MAEAIHIVRVGGKEFTRRSARVYTHAIVGRRDFAAELAKAQEVDANLVANARFHARQHTPGDIYHVQDGKFLGRELTEHERRIYDLTSADVDQNVQVLVRERVNPLKTLRGAGIYRPGVLGWSMSAENAERAAAGFRKHGHIGVYVVPVEERWLRASRVKPQ